MSIEKLQRHARASDGSIAEAQAFYRLAYNKEANDCSVRALAVTCAAPYEIAHAAMHFAGRPPEHGATLEMIASAARGLGFTLRRVECKAKTLRTLCRELDGEPGAYLAVTADHVAGFWQGECIDWCRDGLLRLDVVLAVTKTREHI